MSFVTNKTRQLNRQLSKPAQALRTVSNSILSRVYLMFLLFLLFGVAILLRVAWLQINHRHWAAREMEQQVFFKKVVADRGNILAEDGTVMAVSLPYYRLALDATLVDSTRYPAFRDSMMLLAYKLTDKFDMPKRDRARLDSAARVADSLMRDTLAIMQFQKMLQARQERDRHIYLTRRMVSHKDLQEVITWPLLNLGRLKGGLIVEKIHNKRYYPFGDLASITLGRLSGDSVGIRGIEASFNSYLAGKDGYVLAQKIRGGAYIPLDEFGREESTPGSNVVTTLDVNLQDIVESALREGVTQHKAKYGTAVLMEVTTGKIKALANYPEGFNYALAGRVEPGSVFKLASVLAVLEDSLMLECDTIHTGKGRIRFEDKEITDAHAYGVLTLEQAFAKSSNVAVSKTIYKYYRQNPDAFIRHLERMGITQPASTQIDGEPVPVVHRPGDPMWNGTMLPSMSIGYSLQLTPLQMTTLYNAVANGGMRMRPWLVKELRDGAKVLKQYGPEATGPICSPETAQRLREMMMMVIQSGTATNIRGTSFLMGGKTGTARVTEGGRYVAKYRATFAGFFPAEQPRYTLLVMVDQPSTGDYYGAEVAAPIFRQIAERIYNYDWNMSKPAENWTEAPLRYPAPRTIYAPHAREVFAAVGIGTSLIPATNWIQTASAGHQLNLSPMEPQKGTVPNVRGMSARDAVVLLENLGFRVNLRGHGKVLRQSLLPGHRSSGLSNITLFLG